MNRMRPEVRPQAQGNAHHRTGCGGRLHERREERMAAVGDAPLGTRGSSYPPAKSPMAAAKCGYARCCVAHSPVEPGDLALQEGDLVTLVRKDDNGVWAVRD
jgi:hypothetical protein